MPREAEDCLSSGRVVQRLGSFQCFSVAKRRLSQACVLSRTKSFFGYAPYSDSVDCDACMAQPPALPPEVAQL